MSNKSVEYKMFVNGKHKTVAFEDTEDSPIIPGFLYFRRGNSDAWFNMEELNEDLIFEDENIKLDFVVSECYTHTDKIRVNCDSSNDKLMSSLIRPTFGRIISWLWKSEPIVVKKLFSLASFVHLAMSFILFSFLST